MERTRDLLVDAARQLRDAGVPSPAVDAELLLSYVTGVPRALLRVTVSDVDPDDAAAFRALIAQRAHRIPLQHLTGSAPFRHLELQVGPGVFIPRPETELIVDEVLRFARTSPARVLVDLCTGSGALAISLATELPGSSVTAVELAPEALAWAQRNVEAHAAQVAAAGSALTLVGADATTAALPDGPLADLGGLVDVVVSNPPYVPAAAIPREPEVREHDPALALYGGVDGLDVVRHLVEQAAILLRPGGLLVLEHADVQGEGAGRAGMPGVLRAHREPTQPRCPHMGATSRSLRPGWPAPAHHGDPRGQDGPVIRIGTDDPEDRERGLGAATAALRRGQLVGLPLDTSYGIAADAFSERGTSALRAAKGRPDLSIPVMVPKMATVAGLAEVDATARGAHAGLLAGPAHPGAARAVDAGLVADRRGRAGRGPDAAAPRWPWNCWLGLAPWASSPGRAPQLRPPWAPAPRTGRRTGRRTGHRRAILRVRRLVPQPGPRPATPPPAGRRRRRPPRSSRA